MAYEGDKSWMSLHRGDPKFLDGITAFCNFAALHCDNDQKLYKCPCNRCLLQWLPIGLDHMFNHLWSNGFMSGYTVWTEHGERANVPSLYDRREQIIAERASSSTHVPIDVVPEDIPPTMEILYDTFPFMDRWGTEQNVGGLGDVFVDDVDLDPIAKAAFEKYNRLLTEAQTPVYERSKETVLTTILKAVRLKIANKWSDKSFDENCQYIKNLLEKPNKYPDSYRAVRKILKDMGLGYEIIHACEYGCSLFYKERVHKNKCHICKESRWKSTKDGSKIPRRVVRYFPLTPRLQRLYMSPHTAKDMRWHGERMTDPEVLKHPADGEAWQEFDRSYPDFASEIRNVRLGLATDGFNPFGVTGLSHSSWPIVAMPYNLPPSMAMKKEFNMLVMLISGPKSPGKCLNVFMRPLIEELKMLWSTGIQTYDVHEKKTFRMRAVVMWTISDFPGLGMLGGIQTKGYKACPLCMYDVDANNLTGRMAYQGHRRWLAEDHIWRYQTDKFNGKEELRQRPPSLSGDEILAQILSHDYSKLSLHPKFKAPAGRERLCWTHVSIFWELPYWTESKHRYSLDVMHIEKNVYDNISGTIFGLEGKTKDDLKAREGLKKLGVRKKLWQKVRGASSSRKEKVSQAEYTVLPEQRPEIFEWMKETQYPFGYAGSLKNKVNVDDKKFYGLKTHDCHVLLQRLLPVVIREYLPHYVVDPLIALSRWFQKLCARELKKQDAIDMKDEIIKILCKLERIFPPSFFTIMVHLMIHLPEQVLLTGPVHFTWMFPMERQLGDYKKSVRNTRYPEGCIAEQYIAHECVTYCSFYMGGGTGDTNVPNGPCFDISVVSELVIPKSFVRGAELTKEEVMTAHWCVMQHCTEAEQFIEKHQQQVLKVAPDISDESRIEHFHSYFKQWMENLGSIESALYKRELDILASLPQAHNIYSQCIVNGVKYVTWERDQRLKTQNCGVMVEVDDIMYYGILEAVVELLYTEGMSVILFKCRWYDTETVKWDYGLLSLDTSTSVYEDSPFILASTVRQVFYLDDPKAGEPWRVVNVVSQRGTYSASTLATDESRRVEVDEPYQEPTPEMVSNYIPIDSLSIDYEELVDIEPGVDEDEEDVDEDEEDSDDEEYEDNAGYSDPEEDEEYDDASEEEGHDEYDDDFLRDDD